MNSYSLTIEINANIICYIAYYAYLIIFKFNIFFNALARKVFNIKIIIIYIKNFFFHNKIVKNINYEITTLLKLI